MFDKTVYLTQTRERLIPYEKTIIEKRAPTDESIKLWEEMKEKAYKSIIDAIEVKNNTLNANVIFYKDHLSFNFVCMYRLLLNDKEIFGRIEIDECSLLDKIKVLNKIFDELSKHIADNLISMGMKEGSLRSVL